MLVELLQLQLIIGLGLDVLPEEVVVLLLPQFGLSLLLLEEAIGLLLVHVKCAVLLDELLHLALTQTQGLVLAVGTRALTLQTVHCDLQVLHPEAVVLHLVLLRSGAVVGVSLLSLGWWRTELV